MRVAVFGLGYVGTVTAACLASGGHEVRGVDPEVAKVDMVSGGASPVVEPQLDEMVARAVGAGLLRATTSAVEALEGADVSLLCVGTPSTPRGSTDLAHLRRAVGEIAEALLGSETAPRGFHCVVVRSTVPPGTLEQEVAPILEAQLGPLAGAGVGLASCPEFLREGSGVADFLDPPFTVVGTSEPRVAGTLGRLFAFVDAPFRVVPVRTAEALKYTCNAFHAVKVSFANELSRLLRPLGVDGRSVMELFCEDDRLNISPRYLRPGFAFGGSCLPKDLRSILHMGRMNSVDLPLLTGTLTSNELTLRDVVDQVLSSGCRRVALLGLSFKMQTDDLRESPNVELAETLLGKGISIRIFDPIIQPSRLMGTNLRYIEARLPHLRELLTDSPQTAIQGADAAIASTSAASVVDALVAEPPSLLIDLDGRLGDEIEALPGYRGAGWWSAPG